MNRAQTKSFIKYIRFLEYKELIQYERRTSANWHVRILVKEAYLYYIEYLFRIS
jgi:hypothetical protein